MKESSVENETFSLRMNPLLDRAFLSKLHPKTHLIHYDEHHQEDQETPFISVYANALCVLYLYKTKQLEAFEAASKRLEQLLHFQIQEPSFLKGAFPQYLHLFPHGVDRKGQVKVLVVFEIIKSLFGHLLKSPLKENFLKAMECLKEYLVREEEKIIFDRISSVIIKTLSVSKEERHRHVMTLNRHHREELNWLMILSSHFLDPEEHAKVLDTALGLYHGKIKRVLYHAPSGKYQEGLKRSLCDDYLEYLVEGTLTPRADMDLECVLIKDHEVSGKAFDKYKTHYPCLSGSPYIIMSDEDFAALIYAGKEDNFHAPFLQIFLKKKLSWIHLISERNQLVLNKTLINERMVILELDYPLAAPEDNQNQIEWDLFLDGLHETGFFIDQRKAVIFHPHERIDVRTENICMSLHIRSSDQDARVVGQISMGNRPSQKDPSIAKNHKAYDWRLSLRTLKRAPEFSIKLMLEFQPCQGKLCQDRKEGCFEEQDCQQMNPSHENNCLHLERI